MNRIKFYKTICYRVLSSAIGFAFLYKTTGSGKISAGFTLMELVGKPIIYFLHEKVWVGAEKRAIKKLHDNA